MPPGKLPMPPPPSCRHRTQDTINQYACHVWMKDEAPSGPAFITSQHAYAWCTVQSEQAFHTAASSDFRNRPTSPRSRLLFTHLCHHLLQICQTVRAHLLQDAGQQLLDLCVSQVSTHVGQGLKLHQAHKLYPLLYVQATEEQRSNCPQTHTYSCSGMAH